MKRLVVLVCLLGVTNLPISCGLVGCGPFDTTPYKIVSISSDIGSISDNIFNETISMDFMVAAVRLKIDETARVGQVGIFSFSNVAYACSPPEPNVQHLNSINIISNETIFMNGIEYRGGENLNSIFKIVASTGDLSVEELNEFPDNYRWFFSFANDSIIFQLIDKPDVSMAQKFTFTFMFDDGLEYQSLTSVFSVD